MKPPVSDETRQRVLDLRRRHSLREVADLTGLPLGTVKTICSRSGAFRDNPEHRALFSLPAKREGGRALPVVPEIPGQRVITGDNEVDAVLWLRECIATGQPALIDLALEHARKIRTPLREIERRYSKWLEASNPGSLFASFASMGFTDLSEFAEKSKVKALLRHEALSRFGEALFDTTEAERFCITALDGLEAGTWGDFKSNDVAERFAAHPALLPQTLADCLLELAYWEMLFTLRHAVEQKYAEGPSEALARDSFVFRLLAEIRPRNKEEAIAVFRYLATNEGMDRPETNDILMNLIG